MRENSAFMHNVVQPAESSSTSLEFGVRLIVFREDLTKLEDAVRCSRNLIFILTDKVFESDW